MNQTNISEIIDLSPSQLSDYLLSQNAIYIGEYAGKATIWNYKSEEIIIPNNKKFGDYVQLIISAIGSRDIKKYCNQCYTHK